MIVPFYVTKKCNMCCSYCYEQEKNTCFSLNELKKKIRFIFYKFSGVENKCFIEFIGGEPFLEIKKIKKLLKEIKVFELHSKKKVTCIVSTNGTLLTKKIFSFCAKNCIELFFSLDGIFEANIDRTANKSTFDLILKNINQSLRSNIKTSIHAVITKNNLFLLNENYLFFSQLGVNRFEFGIILNADEQFFNDFKIAIKKLFDFIGKGNEIKTNCFMQKFIFDDSSSETCFSILCYEYAYELSLEYHFTQAPNPT